MDPIITQLLNSNEPSVRYKTVVYVLGQREDTPEARAARQEIPTSPRAQGLLACRVNDEIPFHPYKKWVGSHWVLASLADLDYPPGDESLQPLLNQVYGWLLSKHHERSIKTIAGRVRRCASQEGNALYAALCLSLADGRAQELARRLMSWQWPDGGWNCDRRPEAVHSSFMESLIPLRALAKWYQACDDPQAGRAVEHAAEVFLKRQLFLRQQDGTIIDQDFVRLHYPPYWHYDILFGLAVMAEAGFIQDPRCTAALDMLESKRLPDGGFPAEGKYYRVTKQTISGRSTVGWGATRHDRSNEFVTVQALSVLRAAGRVK